MILGQSITKDNLFSLVWLVSKSFIAAFMQRKCEILLFNCWATFQLISLRHCTESISFIDSLSVTQLYKYAAFHLPHLHFWPDIHQCTPARCDLPHHCIYLLLCPVVLPPQDPYTAMVCYFCCFKCGENEEWTPKWVPQSNCVKGKNQTHMNQSSSKKFRPSWPSFHFHHKFPRKMFIEDVSTSLVPTHSLFWPSIWNVSTPTMYFCFIPKINYLQSFRNRWGSPLADCHFHLVCFLEIQSWFFKSNCSNSFLGKRKYFCNSCWSSGMLLLFTATAFRSLRNGPEAYCDQCYRNIRWRMLPAFSDAG